MVREEKEWECITRSGKKEQECARKNRRRKEGSKRERKSEDKDEE